MYKHFMFCYVVRLDVCAITTITQFSNAVIYFRCECVCAGWEFVERVSKIDSMSHVAFEHWKQFFYHFQFIRCTLSTQNLKSHMNCKKEKNHLQIQNINRIFEFDLNTTFGHQIFLTRPFREQCAHTPQFVAMVWLSGWIRMKLQYFIRGGK